MKHNGVKRNPQSGFALLFIYAMAATVAIMLLMELPRVAFESQRDKEQLLIDRGEQYSRAINLYVRKFNKYPADFDALQSTQNLRFLRRKYVDPMTGKDDWRIVHVGPGGVFTDSLVYGKKKDDKAAEQQNFIAEMQQTGGNQTDPGNQTVNIGTRQRPSDQPGVPGDPNNANLPPQAFQPGQFALPQPGMPQQPPFGVPQPGMPQPGMPQFDANGQPIPNPAAPFPGNQPGFPGQFQQGQQFPGQQFPGQQFPGQQPMPGQPFPGQPFPGGVPGQPGGFQPNGPPNAAGNLINQLLTTPRPGGLNGLGGVQQGAQAVDPNANASGGTTISTLASPSAATAAPAAAQIVGGGIGGVASKREQDGIKVYKDQKSYHKWEFVYDITKDPARTGGMAPQAAPQPNANPTPAPGMNPAPPQNGTTPPGQPPGQPQFPQPVPPQ